MGSNSAGDERGISSCPACMQGLGAHSEAQTSRGGKQPANRCSPTPPIGKAVAQSTSAPSVLSRAASSKSLQRVLKVKQNALDGHAAAYCTAVMGSNAAACHMAKARPRCCGMAYSSPRQQPTAPT